MADKIYCYPNSDVLKNKMGIKDLEQLQCIERRLTMIRILELLEKHMKGLNEFDFIKKLTYYFAEINALHPFREGNGRSQREFIRCLALYNGYIVNFANVSKEEMMKASEDSFLCNYGTMEQLFRKCLRNR